MTSAWAEPGIVQREPSGGGPEGGGGGGGGGGDGERLRGGHPGEGGVEPGVRNTAHTATWTVTFSMTQSPSCDVDGQFSQRRRNEPGSGVARSVTVAPSCVSQRQWLRQLIPGGDTVTLPDPEPLAKNSEMQGSAHDSLPADATLNAPSAGATAADAPSDAPKSVSVRTRSAKSRRAKTLLRLPLWPSGETIPISKGSDGAGADEVVRGSGFGE